MRVVVERFQLRGLGPPELWRVGSNLEFDADGRAIEGCVIMLLQPPAHLACLYADNRIVSSSVAQWPLEEFYSDRTFLQPIVVALQAMVDNVGEELLASLAGLKRRAT
jgi:hypothetical protein